jgi:hypothetical protein
MAEAPAQVLLLPERIRGPIAPVGAVHSAQEAIVRLPPERLEELWRPEYLERLARAYWAYLSRISLGLIRVVYAEDSRIVVLASRRLPLLRFGAPGYDTGAEAASVTWRIQRGLLVASEGRDRGFLRISVRRREPRGELHLGVEVRNFYPWLRGRGRFARFGARLYEQTQVRIHRLVTFGFLRSLSRLDLPPSRIGALRAEIDMTPAER